MMQTYTVGEFKANFSEILDMVQAGAEVGIAFGKSKKLVAKLVPTETKSQEPRKFGMLDGKVKITMAPDWKMTPEQLLGEEP